MRKKGFTLVELLIVIAIIALLMGILMPALARVRMYAYRMTCGTNLSGIGKAILLYSNDSRGEAYPMPGITNLAGYAHSGVDQSFLRRWHGGAPGVAGQGTALYVYQTGNVTTPSQGGAGHATIGSIFYLLVKYQDVSVKQFICKGDVGAKVFKLTDYTTTVVTEFSKAWDFGEKPGQYCSYSYHNPFSPSSETTTTSRIAGFPVGGSSSPAMPLAADRNPTLDRNVSYLDRENIEQGGGTGALPESGKKSPYQYWSSSGGGTPEPSCTTCTYQDPDLVWNSFAHQREGQNVLFNDGHVSFERTANVGIDNDNIWQSWPSVPLGTYSKFEREVGGYFAKAQSPCLEPIYGRTTDTPVGGSWFPAAADDSLLISDRQDCGN